MKTQETDIYRCAIARGSRVAWFIEDHLAPLAILIALSLFVASALSAGCTTTSPERQAHRAVGTTIDTANAAMDVWFAHVQHEEDKLAELQKSDPAEFMARRRALVISEGKVASAWDTYVKAQRALILGAAALGPGEKPTNSETERLKSEVIALVQSLIK